MAADDLQWKTPQFRQVTVARIDEAVQVSGNPMSINSVEMENYIFQKAKSKEEYFDFVVKSILHVTEINSKMNATGTAPSTSGTNNQAADDSQWKTPHFRQSVVAKIDEAIQVSGMPTTKNSIEMENHVFQKAKSKEEYLGFVTRLILHVKEMNSKMNAIGTAPSTSGINNQVSVCKNRNIIRRNRRKFLKMMKKTGNGQSAKKIKLYKYPEQSSFLKKNFDERETKGNIASQENEQSQDKEQSSEKYNGQEENKHEKEQEENEDKNYENNVQNDAKESNDVLNVNDDSQSQASIIANYDIPYIFTKPKIQKAIITEQTAPSKLMDYSIEKNQNNTSQHPVDTFLIGVASTLKTLSPYYLNLAKSEIFTTVQKYEMKMLVEQRSNQGRFNQNYDHTFSNSLQSQDKEQSQEKYDGQKKNIK